MNPHLIARVKGMILAPDEEWRTIQREPVELVPLFTGYVMILAAIPAIASMLILMAFGLFFAALLATMTLGGLNYSNNPALILCFLMLSVMLSALLRGYLNLSGVRLVSLDAAPVHAGSPQPLHLHFSAEGNRPRGRQVRRRRAAAGRAGGAPGADRLPGL